VFWNRALFNSYNGGINNWCNDNDGIANDNHSRYENKRKTWFVIILPAYLTSSYQNEDLGYIEANSQQTFAISVFANYYHLRHIEL
jgi:hypothetical protein